MEIARDAGTIGRQEDPPSGAEALSEFKQRGARRAGLRRQK
jgi:hypothetical protein